MSSLTIKSLYSGLENDDRSSTSVLLPDFLEMSQCIYNKAKSRLENAHQRVTIQNIVSPFNETTFNEVRMLIVHTVNRAAHIVCICAV